MSLLPKQCLKTLSCMVSILTILFLFLGCTSQYAVGVSDSVKQKKITANIHVVEKNDTLYSIAWRYDVDYHKLASLNGIKPPYLIQKGQKIRLDISAKKTKNASKIGANASSPKLPVNSKKVPLAGKNVSPLVAKNRSEIKTNSKSVPVRVASNQSAVKWQWPANGRLLAPFQATTGFNKGIDIDGKLGESVTAAALGQVVYAGSGLRGYGKLLIIKHSEIFLSAYAHNNELLVKEGDFVKAGQRIADMGLSGTNRVKLHFEIRSDGHPVDPLKYLQHR